MHHSEVRNLQGGQRVVSFDYQRFYRITKSWLLKKKSKAFSSKKSLVLVKSNRIASKKDNNHGSVHG